MKVVCVVGDTGSRKASLVERLVSSLSELGATATVTSVNRDDAEGGIGGDEVQGHRDAGAERVVGITSEARFEFVDADSEHDELRHTLDRLADAGYDYTVVEGFSGSSLPKIETSHTEASNVIETDGSETPTEALVEAVEETEDYETLGSLVRHAKQTDSSPKAGALSTFTGRVRAENIGNSRTTHLEYEKYDGVADERMEEIREDLESRDGVYRVLMHHETGVVPAEEDAVHVVVLAGHREEAFRAVEDGINRLKDEVPIFKKEVTEDGEFWTHDTS